MDLNSIVFLSMWLYAMFCKVTESLELTTTSRPPPVAVVLEQSLKAGKIKYGGDVPVIPVEDPSRKLTELLFLCFVFLHLQNQQKTTQCSYNYYFVKTIEQKITT